MSVAIGTYLSLLELLRSVKGRGWELLSYGAYLLETYMFRRNRREIGTVLNRGYLGRRTQLLVVAKAIESFW